MILKKEKERKRKKKKEKEKNTLSIWKQLAVSNFASVEKEGTKDWINNAPGTIAHTIIILLLLLLLLLINDT